MAANRFSSDDPAEERVNELLETLPVLMSSDRCDEALKTVTEMLSIARDLAAKHPKDQAHNRVIAGALYSLAAIQLRLNNPEAAHIALNECESRYEALGEAAEANAPPSSPMFSFGAPGPISSRDAEHRRWWRPTKR